MEQDLIHFLDETTNDMLQTISLFSEESFNKIPFEGSWTGGQVSEHIFKSEAGVTKLLQGNTKPTEGASDAKVETLKKIFLDFSTKMKSPDFILPAEGWHEKEKFFSGLKSNREAIRKLAEEKDLTLTLTDFEMPGMGNLTGIELITFICCHSKRHTHQLKNIYEHIK